MTARFSLGIDLGTSNCAMALGDLDADRPEIVPIPQILAANQLGEKTTLGSALYLPHPEEFRSGSFALPWDDSGEPRIVGQFARDHGALVPDRLVTSAKSWLSNPHIDPKQRTLPWRSESAEEKLSPFDCSRLPRHEWNAALLRGLWAALNEQTQGRKLSVEHEEAWLTLAGFLLRPGFGFAHDGPRMDELWRLRDAGLGFSGKRSKVQEYILWRRVAGGLTAERQERLLAGELAGIRAGKAPPELVRLAGSLERLPRETKADLIETFIAQALQLAEAKQHCAPYLAALGLLLNRTPLYAGPETVVAAEFVVHAYAAFQHFDWAESELMECCNLFLRAARVVNDRNLDVPKSLRNQIARKLESAGVTPIRTATIKAFTPVGRIDSTSLYGESLPPGLVLGDGPD